MADHYVTLLREALKAPDVLLGYLPILPTQELEAMETWNRTQREFPYEKSLADLFQEQATKTPNADALVTAKDRLSYRELHQRAMALAKALHDLGIKREALVGICLERSWEMVAAILGTLRAGAAYVPMDPAYPQERLQFMMRDANAQVVISQKKLRPRLPKTATTFLWIEDINWGETVEPTDFHQTSPTALAYVIYTSGSTGQPKGVALEHRSAVAFISWARETFLPEELDGVAGINLNLF